MKTDFFLSLDSKAFHKMAVHVWGDTTSNAVPLVCVHGLTRTGRDFDRLAEKLSTKRAIYCIDLPGRGLSDDLANPLDYNFVQYCTDMAALIAHIGAPQIDWVGTSLGGILGMVLAAKPQSPLRRLVLNDVGPVLPQEALDRIGKYLSEPPCFADLTELEAHLRKIHAPFGSLSDADWRHMAETSHRKTAQGLFVQAYDPRLTEAYLLTVNEPIDLWAIYDKVFCPTLLIRGAESDLLTQDIAQEMTRRGPCAKLVTFLGTGHAPALMKAEQIKTIEDFLEG